MCVVSGRKVSSVSKKIRGIVQSLFASRVSMRSCNFCTDDWYSARSGPSSPSSSISMAESCVLVNGGVGNVPLLGVPFCDAGDESLLLLLLLLFESVPAVAVAELELDPELGAEDVSVTPVIADKDEGGVVVDMDDGPVAGALDFDFRGGGVNP